MGMIRKDKRMKLHNTPDGVNLQIRQLTTDDAGNYICEVENTGEPILQTNELQVLGIFTNIFTLDTFQDSNQSN